MAIIEVIVPHPPEEGRAKKLDELNAALNKGYAVIDCHSISGQRHYLLHKSDRDIKREKYIPHPDSPHR